MLIFDAFTCRLLFDLTKIFDRHQDDGVHVLLEVDVEGVVENELDGEGQVVDGLRDDGEARLVEALRIGGDEHFDGEREQVAEHNERTRPYDHHGAARLSALDPLAGLLVARASAQRGARVVELALFAQRRAYLDQGAQVGGK